MNPDLNQIETDILVGLSDFIPRNQNQITDLIHKDHEKSTDRVHVHRALKNLAPYLERSPNQLDELGKRWVLKNDIDTIRQIVKKYPSIVPDLQKSDKIINLVFSHIKKESNDFLYAFEEDFFKKMLNLIPNMFRYSVTFLKMFLIDDSYISSFYRILFLIYRRDERFKEYSETEFMQISNFNNFDCFEGMDFDSHWILFEAFNHAVIHDYINGYGNPNALKIIEKLRELGFNRSVYEMAKIEITIDPEELEN